MRGLSTRSYEVSLAQGAALHESQTLVIQFLQGHDSDYARLHC